MSEWNTKKLDPLCREIRKRYPWLPVLAIQWIYATSSQNPVFKEMEQVQGFRIFFVLVARMPWLALRAFHLAARIMWLRLFLNPLLHRFRSQSFDILSKTWVFPLQREESGKDFYLGDMATQINKRGFKILTLYGNATDKNWLRLVWARKSFHFPYQIAELCFLSPLLVFQMVLRQYLAAWVLFWKGLFERERSYQSLLFLVSRDCLRYLTLRNALFYWIGKRAASYWNPKFLLTLYEGNAWEKCLSLGVREVTPTCKLIGYQHTVIMEHALELKNPSHSMDGLRPPEWILSTGIRPLALMESGHKPFDSRFISFGTFRYPLSRNGMTEPRPMQKSLLVLPEGILNEMIILFDAAMALATRLPDYRICLRCHPVIPFDRVEKHLKRSLEKCPNVTLSKTPSIETDFDSSSMLLYRGSSSILSAILKGLKPFYFAHEDIEENRDPLFELSSWRERVFSVEELAQRIQMYSKNQQEKINEDWYKAVAYVQSYVQPVETKSYDHLMEVLQ